MKSEMQGKQELARTTPFPDVLLDRVMPRLRDVEWRLVCVLVRQTLGWQSPDGKPKHSDWLSHSQLRRRTGRSSSAISPAIESLCRNHLAEVDDGQGRPLRTANERRRHRGPLFFRLNLERLSNDQKRFRLKRRFHNSGTTINTLTRKAVVRSEKRNGETGNQKSDRIQREWDRMGKSLPRQPSESVEREQSSKHNAPQTEAIPKTADANEGKTA